MNIESMKKLLQNVSEEQISFDEPHVSLRCAENRTTKDAIRHILLKETNTLTNIIVARPQVYKLYFRLNKRRQLKVIIDILQEKKITIRTIKILDRKLYKNIKVIKRRR